MNVLCYNISKYEQYFPGNTAGKSEEVFVWVN